MKHFSDNLRVTLQMPRQTGRQVEGSFRLIGCRYGISALHLPLLSGSLDSITRDTQERGDGLSMTIILHSKGGSGSWFLPGRLRAGGPRSVPRTLWPAPPSRCGLWLGPPGSPARKGKWQEVSSHEPATAFGQS